VREAQLAGITPYVKRLAAYYAAQGLGTYMPKGYAWFDRVEVRLEGEWTGETQVLRVEFYERRVRQRYVEFAMSFSGFGGIPVVKLVTSTKTSPPAAP
jgi:hypothetical protein